MDFRKKVEFLTKKTSNYEFEKACQMATNYIKEFAAKRSENEVVAIVATFIFQIRKFQDGSTFKNYRNKEKYYENLFIASSYERNQLSNRI